MDFLSLPSMSIPSLNADPTALSESARGNDPASINAVSTGFESMFMSMLLKQMRQTLEPDTLFGQDSSDIMGGLFDFTMGQHLSNSGALGIGAMVKQQLTRKDKK